MFKPTASLYVRIPRTVSTNLEISTSHPSIYSSNSDAMDRPQSQPRSTRDMGSKENESEEAKLERKVERKVGPPPPPQTGVRAFVDRQATVVMKILGVI